jgi:hypothetical protein
MVWSAQGARLRAVRLLLSGRRSCHRLGVFSTYAEFSCYLFDSCLRNIHGGFAPF